jgi:hypothetical protein
VTWAVTLVVAAYSVVIASRPLSGVLTGALVYLVAWLAGEISPGGALDAFGSRRAAATGALAVLAVLYSLVVAREILLGVLTAVVVVAVSWVTIPDGPVARLLGGDGS